MPFYDTDLVFSIKQLTQVDYNRHMFDFYNRKLFYHGRNRGCGHNKLYSLRDHRLVDSRWNQFSCEYYRIGLIKDLKINIVKYAEKYNLTRLITITFRLNHLKRRIRPDNGYRHVMKRFNN